jgi:hypothetical protein
VQSVAKILKFVIICVICGQKFYEFTHRKRPNPLHRPIRTLHHRPKRQKICKKPLRSHLHRIHKRLQYPIHQPKIILEQEVLLFFRCKVTFSRCNFMFLQYDFIFERYEIILWRCKLILLRC